MWNEYHPKRFVQYAKSQSYNAQGIKLHLDVNPSSNSQLLKRQKSCGQASIAKKQSIYASNVRNMRQNADIQKVQDMKNLRLKSVSALYSEWMAKASKQTIWKKQSNKLTLQMGLRQQKKNSNIDDSKMLLPKLKGQNKNENKYLLQNSLLKNLQKSLNERKNYQLLSKKSNQDFRDSQDFELKIDILKGSFLKKEQQMKLKYEGKINQLKREVNKIQNDKKQLLAAYEILKEESKMKDVQVKKLKIEVAQLIGKVNLKRKSMDKGSENQRSFSRRNSQIVRRDSASQILNKFYEKQNGERNQDKDKLKHNSISLKNEEMTKNISDSNSVAIKASRFKEANRRNSRISSFVESSNTSHRSKQFQNFEDSKENSVDTNYYKEKIKQLNETIAELKEQVQCNGVMVLKCKLNQIKAERKLLEQDIAKLKFQIKENWKSRMDMRNSIINLQKRLQIFDEREKFTFQQWGNLFSPSNGNIPAVLKRKIEGNSEIFEEISILENVWKKMAQYYDSLIKNYSKKITDTIDQCEQLREKYLKVLLFEGNE